MAKNVERARRRDSWIELAQRAGRRVARIGEQRLALFGALLIELREWLTAENHLAAHLEQFGNPAALGAAKTQRNAADGAEILGNILAVSAVAASRADFEQTVLVNQLHRETIELDLGDVFDIAFGLEHPLDAAVEIAHLLRAHRVGEREHHPAVLHDRELFGRCGADALGGRIRRNQLRMFAFDLLEAMHQLVELGIRNLGLVEHVVEVVVAVDLLAQALGLGRKPPDLVGHGFLYSPDEREQ